MKGMVDFFKIPIRKSRKQEFVNEVFLLIRAAPATLPTTAFFVAVAFGSTPRFRILSTTFFKTSDQLVQKKLQNL